MSLRLHGHGVALLPRVIVAGLSGDGGKSLVTISLIRTLVDQGIRVAPYKKGPDYIDAAWLGRAAGRSGRNLDTFLMPGEAIMGSLARASADSDIVVMEGNRGLYDGMTAAGDHSTATLAKLAGAPVILVVNATKTTRTVAALVKGCQVLDPEVTLGGVVLNQVATPRQERVIREAVRNETGLEVMGAIPRLKERLLPSRHLGLVTAAEHPKADEALATAGEVGANYLDIEAIQELAKQGSACCASFINSSLQRLTPEKSGPRIGVLRDKAFSFYYPENLEALEASGATLVFISPTSDEALPDIDGLYAGGGFPEVYPRELSENRAFRDTLKKRINKGLVVWAECGGLMYLARSLMVEGEIYPMVGALPVDVEQTGKPKGHGYARARVDRDNPFFEVETEIRGHEFHYSRILGGMSADTILSMTRGVGVGDRRDGIRVGNAVAAYTHLHALGTPSWAPGFVAAVEKETP